MDTVVMAFIISFCVTLTMLVKKVNESNELTKSNYWNLKNELKKKAYVKRKPNTKKNI